MVVAGMQPDEPGNWLFRCRVNDHISAGMSAPFEVDGSASHEGQAQVDDAGHAHG